MLGVFLGPSLRCTGTKVSRRLGGDAQVLEEGAGECVAIDRAERLIEFVEFFLMSLLALLCGLSEGGQLVLV